MDKTPHLTHGAETEDKATIGIWAGTTTLNAQHPQTWNGLHPFVQPLSESFFVLCSSGADSSQSLPAQQLVLFGEATAQPGCTDNISTSNATMTDNNFTMQI
jgi:hypothetical protein